MDNNKKEVVKKGRPVKTTEVKQGWLPDVEFSDRQKALIKKLVAPTLNEEEFNLFIYRCLSLRLDPLKGEISVHKRKEHGTWCKDRNKCTCPEKMIVVVQRDGYLTVAHRSGQFNGMKTDLIFSPDGQTTIGANCKVWNKSAEHPVDITVYMKEYNTGKQVWATKPMTMIGKVAESQALRRAFNISGVYSPEEIESWNGTNASTSKEIPAGEKDNEKPTLAQLKTLQALKVTKVPETQREAKELIAEAAK